MKMMRVDNSGFPMKLFRNVIYYIICLLSVPHFPQGAFALRDFEHDRVLKNANKYIADTPVTITSFKAGRSAGGMHDYFSESDYWWPDPQKPDGPYIQKDGMTNPENFVKHREALRAFSQKVPALAAAYKLTGDRVFADKAIAHLRAWLLNENTMMNPSLLYSQAIRNKVTGRGIGIIDTIHLIEITKAIETLEAGGALTHAEADLMRDWFRKYLKWLTTHQYGNDEKEQKNNHGSWWLAQVAVYAAFTHNDSLIAFARNRFMHVSLPNQMAQDGSFPLELKRTKPYNYSLFNLEAFCLICQVLSDQQHDLWGYTLPDGRNMKKGLEFIYPYILDKKSWPYPPDVMYFEHYPFRQSALLFAGLHYGETKFLRLWQSLPADSDSEEIIRTFAIRQPVLWF